ncbi:hypothetical protein C9374_004784 [Naegleria lovaniensis]|uniref:Uncharacterized protein n=1 Tax=Naegleria lovaniensis TaxID=51637 RepID=A0AA88KJ17_NAELO|nr:uncharacterized protein C9374_004784 [Naegleria lovaniensis]KAG2382817.1 hypothetical protein C9374_004784 [Naegleria lovaniensis]
MCPLPAASLTHYQLTENESKAHATDDVSEHHHCPTETGTGHVPVSTLSTNPSTLGDGSSENNSTYLTNSPRGRLDRYKLYSSPSSSLLLKDPQHILSAQSSTPTNNSFPQHHHLDTIKSISTQDHSSSPVGSKTPKTPHLIATTQITNNTPRSSSLKKSSSKLAVKTSPITIRKKADSEQALKEDTPSKKTSKNRPSTTGHSDYKQKGSKALPNHLISASLSPVALKTGKRMKDPTSPMQIKMHDIHATPPKHLEKFLKFCHPLMKRSLDANQVDEITTTQGEEEHDCDEDESMSMGNTETQDMSLDKSGEENQLEYTLSKKDCNTTTNTSLNHDKDTTLTTITIVDNTVFHDFECMCEICKKEREAIHNHHLSLSNMKMVHDCPRNIINRSSILNDEWHVKRIENDHGIAELQKSTLLPFVKPKSQIYVRPITNFNGTKHFLGVHSNSDIVKYVHNKDPKHFKPFEEFQLIAINKVAKEKRAAQSRRYFNLLHILPIKCKPLKKIMDLYKIDDVMYAIFILITSLVKGYKVRKQVRQWRSSAITIQHWWRAVNKSLRNSQKSNIISSPTNEELSSTTIFKPTNEEESLPTTNRSHEQTIHDLKLKLCQLFHENGEIYTKRAQVLQLISKEEKAATNLDKCIHLIESEIQSYQKSQVETDTGTLLHQKAFLERSLRNHFERSVAPREEQLELEQYCFIFEVPIDHPRRLTKLVKKLFSNPTHLIQQEASAEIFSKYFSY